MIGAAFGDTLARAQAGDERAFACLFRDVQPALLRYLGVIASEAEDVAGETWLQVVAGLDAGDVARMVGKTPGAVRVAAHRGLRRLADVAERAGVTQ